MILEKDPEDDINCNKTKSSESDDNKSFNIDYFEDMDKILLSESNNKEDKDELNENQNLTNNSNRNQNEINK